MDQRRETPPLDRWPVSPAYRPHNGLCGLQARRIGAGYDLEQGREQIHGYGADEIRSEHVSRFHTENDRREGLPALALSHASREGRFESEGWRVR